MRKRWNVLLIAGAVMALAVGCGAKEETKSVQETSAVSETARTGRNDSTYRRNGKSS